MEIIHAGLPAIDAQQSARLLALLGFGSEDIRHLSQCGASFGGRAEAIASALIHDLSGREEAAALLQVEEVRIALVHHVTSMTGRIFAASRGESHAHASASAGAALARLGAPLGLLSATFLSLQEILEGEIRACPSLTPEQAHAMLQAVSRLLAFDHQVAMESAILCRMGSGTGVDPLLRQRIDALERELVEKNQQMERISFLDPLTGLANHQRLLPQIRIELSRAGRVRDPLTLIALDLNSFGAFNRKYGAEEGDKVLIAMARTLQRTFRESDFLCRYAADGFCVVMPRAGQEQAVEVCRRLIPNFKEAVQPMEVSFSLGVAQSGPEGHLPAEVFLQQAMDAMTMAMGFARKSPGFYIQRADVEKLGNDLA